VDRLHGRPVAEIRTHAGICTVKATSSTCRDEEESLIHRATRV
jgi:hypothetical protein